jgi:4-hydroxythreonine-4-phosphate dehydrogenase
VPAPLVITCGDPSGIGPELILKAWNARHERPVTPFGVIADPQLLRN